MRRRRPFLRQKPVLYFDENFPREVIEAFREDSSISKCFKIYSVFDFGNEKRDDDFQYGFARDHGFTLVSMDQDFLNDRKYPIQKIPGIIVILAGRNQPSRIMNCLLTLTRFISVVPRPKAFMGDSKFQVSLEGCVMRARDARTREIKTLPIAPGDRLADVAAHYHYFA